MNLFIFLNSAQIIFTFTITFTYIFNSSWYVSTIAYREIGTLNTYCIKVSKLMAWDVFHTIIIFLFKDVWNSHKNIIIPLNVNNLHARFIRVFYFLTLRMYGTRQNINSKAFIISMSRWTRKLVSFPWV